MSDETNIHGSAENSTGKVTQDTNAFKKPAQPDDMPTRPKEPYYPGSDSLTIGELHWYTTAEHIVEAAARAGVQIKRSDVTFAEHKVNGKTKGSVVVACHSEQNASKIAHWFHTHEFQGKKINPTFLNPHAINPFKPNSTGPRPMLNTQILLAHGPTNAHGGVNFNRVRPARIAQQAQAHAMGMGWPTGFHGGHDGVGPEPGRRSWGQTLHPQAHPFVPTGGMN